MAGIGLAGVNVPRFLQLMNAWDHPFRAVYLTTAIHIACLGAHGGKDGALAPLVVQAATEGDPQALAIVREGAAYLDAMAEKLFEAGAESFCMLGGLSEVIMPWMSEAVSRHIAPPLGQPDSGALQYAMNEFRREQQRTRGSTGSGFF